MSTNKLPTPSRSLTPAQVGAVANAHASAAVFEDYRGRKARNTIARQDRELAVFCRYLEATTIRATPEDLAHNPAAWQDMTWGNVAGFVQWLLREGYAVASINVRLATIRAYARLAHQAGTIGTDEWLKIQSVKGFSRKEGARKDETREVKRRSTRKADAPILTREQVKVLKEQHDDTPQGRRDRLLMCLLLNMGLRVGEITLLRAQDFNLGAGTLTFHRPKVDKVQTQQLKNGMLEAARAYITQDVTNPAVPLLRSTHKGELTDHSMTRYDIARRVRELGRAAGIDSLSPHDCRHSWATRAARRSDVFTLRDAGGWSSLAMPSRYVEAAKVANERLELDD